MESPFVLSVLLLRKGGQPTHKPANEVVLICGCARSNIIFPDQAGEGDAAVVALGKVLGHGFAAGQAQSHVLAIAPIQVRAGTAPATRRL